MDNGYRQNAAKARASARSQLLASRWVVAGILVFALTGSTSALATAGPSEQASVAGIAPGDQAATYALLTAEYKLEAAILAHVVTTEVAVARAAKALGHECKGVLRGAPDESVIEEEGPFVSSPMLSGRAQGERARSEQEKQTIDREIDETISAPADRALRGPYEAYLAAAQRLTWSDPAINALVQQKTARLRGDLSGPAVMVCAEMRTWAASDFHMLPSGSRSLQEAREARDKQAVEGNLEVLLRPYEDSTDRPIVRRITALREHVTEEERTDEVSLRADYHMELALGEKLSRIAEQEIAPVIGKGRTSAGGTFVIRASIGKSSRGSCKHDVEVEVRRRGGGSSGGICLSEGAHAHPSSSCSGPVEIVETVEFATSSDVHWARVRLSDGRTVTVSVVHVPAKDGGPAGVFIDAFRGYKPYPVSVQELSLNGTVLRTVVLSGVRCRKESATESSGPQIVNLATVPVPSGELRTIEGTLFRFRGQTEFSLSPQPSERNSEAHQERGESKQFQWDLSTECAPHPYSLLYGILVPPGASVLVRTPAGLTPLSKVELPASTHTQGSLVYSVYTAPPTEIVVERSDGSVLYTESLGAKATEETEFCEGYAEP